MTHEPKSNARKYAMIEELFFNNPFESITELEKELEAEQVKEIVELTRQLLKKRYTDKGTDIRRGVHPKSHGCVHAKFEVLDGIDKDLQFGLFAKPATYDAVIRCSNAAVDLAHDLIKGNASRGMAIKVLDVEGDVLIVDNERKSQDFLMVNTSSFVFSNVADYLRLNTILLEDGDVSKRFFAPLAAAKADPPVLPSTPEEAAIFGRVLRSFKIVKEIQSKVVGNPLEVAYYGAAPFLYGPDNCAHFSVEPAGGEQAQELPEGTDEEKENYLRDALKKTISGDKDVVYEFKAQVRNATLDSLSIEDASASWAPQTVARITIPAPQLGLSEEECEELVFTPWHALADHQPIGSINRLRYAVYLASSNLRLGKECY
jgi:hypothetical protein